MNRNKIIRDFLESDATHLIFIENENGETIVHSLTSKVNDI
jgi:hypothetical protein